MTLDMRLWRKVLQEFGAADRDRTEAIAKRRRAWADAKVVILTAFGEIAQESKTVGIRQLFCTTGSSGTNLETVLLEFATVRTSVTLSMGSSSAERVEHGAGIQFAQQEHGEVSIAVSPFEYFWANEPIERSRQETGTVEPASIGRDFVLREVERFIQWAHETRPSLQLRPRDPGWS